MNFQEYEDESLLRLCRLALASLSVGGFSLEHLVYVCGSGDFFLGIGAEIALLCDEDPKSPRWEKDATLRG